MHKQEKCNTIVTYNTSHMNNNLNQQKRFKLFSVLKTESRNRYQIIYIYIYTYIHRQVKTWNLMTVWFAR